MTQPTLIVTIRGWSTTGDRLLGKRRGAEIKLETLQALRDALPNAQVWAPDLDMSMFCMRSPEALADELFSKIDSKLRLNPEIKSVVLLGYSSGSLLARRVFCMAHGADKAGGLSGTVAPWARKIDRLVMLAGITRGWEYSTASPDHVRFLAPLLQQTARFVGWVKGLRAELETKTPFILQLRRGSPFVITTRIQYVQVFEALRRLLDAAPHSIPDSVLRKGRLPSTIFLLGARDEFVSPEDCTELGPRVEFAFVELDGSNHAEAMLIAGDDPIQVERRKRLVAALTQEFDSLVEQPWAVRSADIDDYLDPMDLTAEQPLAVEDAARVEHAVMVVHGIRDSGFWTKRVAREIKTLARTHGIEVRAPTPSYGYFSMWDFVKPGGREKAAYWFMDRYADVRSHFPNARISFVGHSNGTYIAARALELCPAVRFERIVFAGSVVRRSFPWRECGGQVRSVLNYVGSSDGVVAFLPAVFECLHLRWLDVGGAGAFGFDDAALSTAQLQTVADLTGEAIDLHEVRFVDGGHGAAIGEGYWPEIANFVLLGNCPNRLPVVRQRRTRGLFRVAPAITALGVLAAVVLLTLPVSVAALVAKGENTTVFGVAWIVLAVLSSLGISWLFGRFLRAW